MTETDIAGEPITKEGLAELEAEIEDLEGNQRMAMAERIKSARELGDLKENAEYHIAKDDQAHLETKIKRLRHKLRTAVVVEAEASTDVFGFGRTAEVTEVETGTTRTWKLVGSTEQDLSAGRISAESPVGMALRDAPVGEDIAIRTPRGKKSYRVEKLVS